MNMLKIRNFLLNSDIHFQSGKGKKDDDVLNAVFLLFKPDGAWDPIQKRRACSDPLSTW